MNKSGGDPSKRRSNLFPSKVPANHSNHAKKTRVSFFFFMAPIADTYTYISNKYLVMSEDCIYSSEYGIASLLIGLLSAIYGVGEA